MNLAERIEKFKQKHWKEILEKLEKLGFKIIKKGGLWIVEHKHS